MIELKHVSFAYQGQEHDGLHDINLTIADGECVLFCGRSGCGKTTITRLVNGLIPQFYAGKLTGRRTGGWTGDQQAAHVPDRC